MHLKKTAEGPNALLKFKSLEICYLLERCPFMFGPKNQNQNKLKILVFLETIWPNVKEYLPIQDLHSRDLTFNILNWQKELRSAYKGTLLQAKQIKLKWQTTTYNFYTEKHGKCGNNWPIKLFILIQFYKKTPRIEFF